MSDVITLTHANFATEVLNSPLPVIVDYWAPWCGPCRIVGPVIEQIAAERADSVKVGKVNVDEQPHLAHTAQIQSIPTIVLYRDGHMVAEAIGALPKRELEDALALEEPGGPAAA